MQEHRFRVGQLVRFLKAKPGDDPTQRYKVLRLLPAERDGPQYRLEPLQTGRHERIAVESELQELG